MSSLLLTKYKQINTEMSNSDKLNPLKSMYSHLHFYFTEFVEINAVKLWKEMDIWPWIHICPWMIVAFTFALEFYRLYSTYFSCAVWRYIFSIMNHVAFPATDITSIWLPVIHDNFEFLEIRNSVLLVLS